MNDDACASTYVVNRLYLNSSCMILGKDARSRRSFGGPSFKKTTMVNTIDIKGYG